MKWDYFDGVFEVDNLTSGENTITIRYNNADAEDSLMLIHDSFTVDEEHWQPQGNVDVFTSGAQAYAKGDALKVTGRTMMWNGVKLFLDPMKFKVGKTYTFTTYVWSPIATTYKLTFNDGLDKPNNGSYHNSSESNVPAGQWTKISCNVTFPEDINPYGMFMLIETGWSRDSTFDISGNYATKDFTALKGAEYNIYGGGTVPDDVQITVTYTKSGGGTGTVQVPNRRDLTDMDAVFALPDDAADSGPATITFSSSSNMSVQGCALNYWPEYYQVDEFVAVEGNHNITVEEGTGVVTIDGASGSSSGGDIYNCSTMQNYSSNGWSGWGSPNLSQKQYQSNYAVVVSNRTQEYYGVAKDVNLEHGKQYHLRSQVAGHRDYGNNTGGGSHTIKATLKYTNTNGGTGYYTVNSVTSTGDEWVSLDADFTLPSDADASKTMTIYYEASGTGANSEFEVWSSRLYTDVTSSSQGDLEAKPGYTIDGSNYVSNYSLYNIDFDSDSITDPLHIDGAGYQEDTSFSRVITLSKNDANNWAYHWTKGDDPEDLQEEAGKMYQYYIEESGISTDDYLITYENNNVATNTADNPITVTNKYIWYRLPATGGRGTRGIYILGAALTTLSLLSGCALGRRRRRYD